MTKWLTLLLGMVALASLACGFTTAKPTPTPRPTEVPIPADAEIRELVLQRSHHESAEIKVGDFVRWTNKTNSLHTVTHSRTEVGVTMEFDNSMQAGETFTFQFTKPGVYRYVCSIHPAQENGTITVTE